MRKKSFFEKLTGSIRMDNGFEDDFEQEEDQDLIDPESNLSEERYEEPTEGQLTVDVINTDEAIIVKAMTAGVRKDDLEINLSREMITIRGHRKDEHEDYHNGYVFQELYWGTFSRTIVLPEEIDIEEAYANESHGLVTIVLPKIDKKRQTTLKIQ